MLLKKDYLKNLKDLKPAFWNQPAVTPTNWDYAMNEGMNSEMVILNPGYSLTGHSDCVKCRSIK